MSGGEAGHGCKLKRALRAPIIVWRIVTKGERYCVYAVCWSSNNRSQPARRPRLIRTVGAHSASTGALTDRQWWYVSATPPL